MGNLIKFVEHCKEEKFITVSLDDCHYQVSYYVESGEKYLTHLNGYCAGTSDLIVSYPANDDEDAFDYVFDGLSTILDNLKSE